jgi:hypothetical protein
MAYSNFKLLLQKIKNKKLLLHLIRLNSSCTIWESIVEFDVNLNYPIAVQLLSRFIFENSSLSIFCFDVAFLNFSLHPKWQRHLKAPKENDPTK